MNVHVHTLNENVECGALNSKINANKYSEEKFNDKKKKGGLNNSTHHKTLYNVQREMWKIFPNATSQVYIKYVVWGCCHLNYCMCALHRYSRAH